MDEQSETRRDPGAGPATIRVLYVDDDDEFAALVASGLELAADIEVEVAPTASDAVETLEDGDSRIDCVVCEYDLPSVEAPALVVRLRRRRPSLPVILFSDAPATDIADAVSAGVTDHLRKSRAVERHEQLADRVRASVQRTRAEINYREIFEKVDAGIVVYDPASVTVVDVNRTFCRMLGYTRPELLGGDGEVSIAASDYQRERARTRLAAAHDEGPQRFEWLAETRGGDSLWIEVSLREARIDDEPRILAMVRDISDRKRRERELHDERAFVDSVIDGIPDVHYTFDTDGTLVRWNRRIEEVTGHDEEQLEGMHALKFVAEADREDITASLAAVVTNGEQVTTESRLLTADGETIPYEFTAAPITDETGSIVGLTGIGRDISDRVEREQLLEHQRDELERLDHVNGVIRSIVRSLIDADSREDIEQHVCDHLAASEFYRFAWVGEYSTADRMVKPRAWAGVEDGYLDDIEIRIDGSETSRGPAGRAIRNREVSVAQHITEDPDFEPWREDALERGYRSSAGVPIVAGETLYGVVGVYADEPDAFDEEERAVLAELGETIGYAIEATERKSALTSDAVIELELRFVGTDHFARTVAERTDATVRLEGVVPRPEGSCIEYVTVEGAPVEEVRALIEDHPDVRYVAVTSKFDREALFEVLVEAPSVAATVAEHGATIRDLRVESDLTIVADLPKTTDVRALMDALQSRFPGVELLARRERERSLRTRTEFRETLDERLTERQRTALEAAYRAGYFERPRHRTGQEMADSLDISPSTFTQHLRAGQRKLLGLVFDE
ncbi:PAS domain S-box protein [Halomarina litorea]|uniref:PAS domain S-box protein n=1 Tax=Halomarina litorea TaxID=2961595 RepID=UPI0020C21C50|nr:bacterio-opsin activator domain-containing protein [Halomarina sp. BCD28]